MKISIITVVLNQKLTIEDAVKSVRKQTHNNVEHIVQDGCSVDGTIEILNKLSFSNTDFCSEPDTGIYDAINKGILRSSGDIIGLMHSDDTFASKAVLKKVSQIFSNHDVDGVFGDMQYISARKPDRIIRNWKSGEYTPKKLKKGWMPPHTTLFLRRSVFEKYGLYDTDFKIAGDYDAILRYLTKGKIKLHYIPEVLVKMQSGGKSNRSVKNILLKVMEDYRAIRCHKVGGIGTLFFKNFTKIGQFNRPFL
ncbi:glycosyltransferase [Amylibacter sp.]|nr:glycosyltransferase [Amylibacter sp.]